ncbi:SMAD/FHA domain-containing protein [Podospora australis]|uniref:SMAD/FHA domain-containing protein n=1 Tax=Podospora australis TaxID=1536484 RepID=A0AAN6X1B5_9PEZI|nr:SMAD/FHA domain-containing protein [Podospora australis]
MKDDGKTRHRDEELGRSSHRHRSRDRKGRHRHSVSPVPRDKRSRSRDRERRRDRDRHDNRDRDRDDRRHRSRSREGKSERRRSRSPGAPSSRRQRDENQSEHSIRDLRRRRSPGYENTRSSRRRDIEDGEPKQDAAKSLVKRRGPLPSQDDSFAVSTGEEIEKPKEKPNFGTSGVLAAASNSVTQADGTTITLKYHEPPEARKPLPRDEWKLFVFKGQDIVDTIELGSRSCWLIGRETSVVDLLAEHPSISKQHAVIQFRYTEKRNEYGDKIGRVKPYLIDLESANGTMLNGDKVPESRYLELRNKDMVQFGSSTREYVLMLAPKN